VSSAISLRGVTLRYAALYFALVVVTGASAAAGAYYWQRAWDESLRLQSFAASIQEIRGTLYRQTKELFDATLLDDVYARGQYRTYALKIDRLIDLLSDKTRSDRERAAVTALRESYRRVQQLGDRILDEPLPYEREARQKMLEGEFEADALRGYEQASVRVATLIAAQQDELRERLEIVTRYAPWALAVPVVAGIALLLVTNLFLRRALIKPLSGLIDATASLTLGDLDRRVPETGAFELVRIGRAINAMAVEIARHRDALVQAERQATLGALVPVVAHNIRNPLASIRAMAQVIDDGQVPDDAHEGLRDIIAATDRLERWTDALLTYLNPLRLQRVPTDVAALVDDVLALLEPTIAARRVTIDREGWSADTVVRVDAHLVEQAVHGLLVNALDASPAGARLGLSLSRNWATLRLEIRDGGAGIGFVPRPAGLTPGPTTKRMGTGLGIPFATKVCELHGGRIEFLRPAGGGTVVVVELPSEVALVGNDAAHA
jgi:signal transduction histidine kinase